MAADIRIEAATDGSVDKSDVYAALRGIDPTDLSASSPVSNQLPEAFVAAGSDGVAVKVEGHDGEWSAESQAAVLSALEATDGIESAEVVSGGHDPDDAEEDEPDGDDGEADEEDEGEGPDDSDAEEESPGVETIDGVGSGRAETLQAAGIETVDDVLDVGVDGLVAAGISDGVAENIVEAAA